MKAFDRRKLKDGEPCDHPGCKSHISHPCEGCGRIGGRYFVDLKTPPADTAPNDSERLHGGNQG